MGTYTVCGMKRLHHVSKRLQTTRTRKRTAVVGACTAPVVDTLLLTCVSGAMPVPGLPATTGCVAVTVRTGSALAALGEVAPHLEAVHLRAGSSLGTGGGLMVTNGGVEVGGGYSVGGIVGGGGAPASTERGMTAKLG